MPLYIFIKTYVYNIHMECLESSIPRTNGGWILTPAPEGPYACGFYGHYTHVHILNTHN